MFAVNAVPVVIYQRYRNNIRDIFSHIENEARKLGKDLGAVDKKHIREAAYSMYTNFRPLNEYAFRILSVFSLAGIIVPFALLTWSAICPDRAKVSSSMFIFLVITFVMVAPVLYFLFYHMSGVLMNHVRSKSFTEPEIEMIKMFAESRSSFKEIQRDLLEIELQQRKLELKQITRKARKFFTRKINPLSLYSSWRVNRIIKKLESEKHNKAN
jgi:hypothetical protein